MVCPTMLSQFRHCHFADCLGVSSLDLGRVYTRPFFWEPCVMKIKSIRSANRHREGDKQLLQLYRFFHQYLLLRYRLGSSCRLYR